MKALLFQLFFYFLLTLGPQLPPRNFGNPGISGFSMLEMNGEVYVIGGQGKGSGGGYNYAFIYQLSCSCGLCNWSTLHHQLKQLKRQYLVAIPVQNNFCTTVIIE